MNKNTSYLFPVLFAAESAFLLYMALQPGYAIPSFHFPFFRGGDLEHFLAYLVYGFLGYRTFSLKFIPRQSLLISLAFCAMFGALTEGLQAFVPTRFADPMDWLVDAIGSSAGALSSRKLGMPKVKSRHF